MKNDRIWEKHYQELVEYKNEYGNIDVPERYINKNSFRLGRWLFLQRVDYNHDKLDKRKIELLENIGMKWHIRVSRKYTWDDWYNKVEEYYLEYGNIDIPLNYVTEDGFHLRTWLDTQRKAFKGVIATTLTENQISRLEKLNIKWYPREDNWDMWYSLLEEYKEKYKDINVPLTYKTDDGKKLGHWLNFQRSVYNGNFSSILSKEQIKLLNNLGMRWNLREDNWDRAYDALAEFYKKYGHTNVSFDYKTDDNLNLGTWLNTQRQKYKCENKKGLTSDQKMLLNDLKVDWSLHTTSRLKKEITNKNNKKYKIALLDRMRHILEDLSYEIDGSISSKEDQEKIEKEIIKRMWR